MSPAASDLVPEVKRDFPLLMGSPIHYLDSAATAQVPRQVLDAVETFETSERSNVHGGVHCHSRAAIAAYEGARADVARFLNAPDVDEIVFTYGATSAINLAAFSFGETLSPGDEIVISELEHHSNLIPWQMLAQRRDLTLRYLPVTADGRLDLTALDRVVTDKCRLVAITHCSNVTGAVTDLSPIVSAARSVGARVLVDGAQQVPHGPVDVQALGADFYAFSGHKMFGPTGIGALWGRRDLLADMPPFMTGGQMARTVAKTGATYASPPQRFEAGTPPIAGAVGLGAAIRWMEQQDWAAAKAVEMRLTKRMLDGLRTWPEARVIGPSDLKDRHGVVSFTVAGVDTAAICDVLDRHDVAVRCGDHCAQLLLAAVGVETAARASVAIYSDDADIDAFLNALDEALST